MSWATPLAFLFLLPVFAILAWQLWPGRRSRPTFVFPGVPTIKGVARGWKTKWAWVPTVGFALALGLAIVALARPQKADTKIKRNVEGIDIVIAFDISDSMLIEDMQPENRLESAKDTIAKFIKARVSDRIGLVVFAGESYTRVPMTLDYPLLLSSLAALETAKNIKMGTAIGVGLVNAVARLKDSTAKSRVIIFMTDGENNTGTIDPETALEMAKGYGMKIYSIGVGRDGDAQLPVVVQDVFGRKVRQYRPIHSSVNEALLSKMANETGGKFWRATDAGALRSVFSEINRLEKTDIETSQFTKYSELFPPYLRWAVILYVLAVFLSVTVFRRGP